MSVPSTPPHYPFVTRMIHGLHREGLLTNVASIDIEPEYGYAVRLQYHNGAARITRGNDVGLNAGAAADVVKDKAYTKYFLTQAGVRTPAGSAFLTRWWHGRISARDLMRGIPMRNVNDALEYVNGTLGFPVYIKPTDGSKGHNVWLCSTADEMQQVLERFEDERVRVALIEQPVRLPDFRLVVLDGELISAYQRVPLAVTGDGVTKIRQLLEQLQAAFRLEGRDTSLRFDDERIAARLGRSGLTLDSVPSPLQHVQLHDISNLSAGGSAVDFTNRTADPWRDLAVEVARVFGLRFCGVDLACHDISDARGEYSVLEVNATPGLDHYGASGEEQSRIVRELYAHVLNRIP